MSAVAWQDVAADGTDPERLAEVVQRRLASGGDAGRSAAEVVRRWCELGVRVALPEDPCWPSRLGRLADPPQWFGWRGSTAPLQRPSVAIVGARRATQYGTAIAAWLADAASTAGVTVISGGAVGIDAAAHGAAVAGGTVVVLGCGHDVAYPRPHATSGGLFDRVVAGGGTIVSELLPRQAAKPHAVRSRNRIVAALADVVVVVEGGARSGALITAGAAADAGVDVLAVPGDVRAPGSAAPHRLLSEGAGICRDPQDLLAAVGAEAAVAEPRPAPSVLPDVVRGVLSQRWPRPVRVDELAVLTELPVAALLAALTRARVAGEVAQGPQGVQLRRAPPTGGQYHDRGEASSA